MVFLFLETNLIGWDENGFCPLKKNGWVRNTARGIVWVKTSEFKFVNVVYIPLKLQSYPVV